MSYEYQSQVLTESIDWITGHTMRKVRTIRNQVLQIILAEKGTTGVLRTAHKMDNHLIVVEEQLEQVMEQVEKLRKILEEANSKCGPSC